MDDREDRIEPETPARDPESAEGLARIEDKQPLVIEDPILEELEIEEVSIDGMCGVY